MPFASVSFEHTFIEYLLCASYLWGAGDTESQNRPSPCPQGRAGETVSVKTALRHGMAHIHSLVHSLAPVFAWHKYLSTRYVQSYNDAEVAKQSRDCSAGAPLPVGKTDITQVNKGTRKYLAAGCAVWKTRLHKSAWSHRWGGWGAMPGVNMDFTKKRTS